VMNATICQAIRHRRVLKFSYNGGTRVVEPHAHGLSTTGKELLRGYQTSGFSTTRRPPFWSLFDVANITGLVVTHDTFPTNRPGYTPDDSAMEEVHCDV